MNTKEVSSKQEIQYLAIGFILSLLHWSACLLFFASLLFLFKQGLVGCIKGLLILTARGVLSTAVGVSTDALVGTEKLALIFLFSIYILSNHNLMKTDPKQFKVVNILQLLVWLFSAYAIFASLFTGSYPVVSIFKIISFVVPFTALVYGVSVTKREVNWAQYCYSLLTPLMIASLCTVPFGKFKIVNESFQGVINHPNLFGIFGAIYICFLLYSNYSSRGKSSLDGKRWLMLILALVMIYLSESRTGMFSSATILAVYYLTMNSDSKIKFTMGLLVILVLAGVYFVVDETAYANFSEQVSDFIYKRETDDILESRLGQLDASSLKYNTHKFIGSGFGVSYDPNIKDFSLDMSLTYEAGNLFISVLGDSGIIGMVLFAAYMLYILFNTKPKKLILFVSPIIISCGEMAFFATNNIAIFYYIMFGLCLCLDEEVAKDDAQHNSAGLQRGGLPQKMCEQSA